MRCRFLGTLVLWLLFHLHGFAQSTNGTHSLPQTRLQEAGLPFIQNFRPRNYQISPQNWAIIQDRRGVMYFGNMGGVVAYDGNTWQTIALPNLSPVYSLALDEHGQIYVGGNNELGYLASDARGQLHYVSLLQYVPLAEREFGRVRKILVTAKGIFFETAKYLLRLRKDSGGTPDSVSWTSTIWQPEVSFYRLHFAQNQVLISLSQKLLVLRGDSLHLILHHAEITNAAIDLMLPYAEETADSAQQESRLLLGTRSAGLFLYDGVSLKPFDCEANAYLQENKLYHGAALPDDRYALATLWGGVVIMDRQGRLLQIINKAAGLHNESILHVFPDREGGLWLGTDGGIARIEISTPISFFQESQGLNGQVYRIVRHRNRLFVGTSSGLAYLAEAAAPGITPVLKYVPEMQAQTRELLSDGQSLLVGGSEGLYQLDENGRSTLVDESGPDCFLRSKKDARRIYVGLVNGLAVLPSVAGKLQALVKFPGISGDVRFVAEDTAGVLWVAEVQQGLSRVELSAGELTPATAANIKIERFGSANGLPEGWIAPYDLHNRIIIATPKGLRRFDPATRTFPSDSSFGPFFADTSRAFHSLKEDSQKQIWMVQNYQGRDEIGVAVPEKDGAYAWVTSLFSRIGEFGYMNDIYADPEQPGVMWLGCEETLVRYDDGNPHAAAVDFPALVRRVTMKGDSVIYGGAEVQLEPVIAYANNALRFEYAAPTFDNLAATRYQYYLEGFEDAWSAWTAETKKEYTNLPEGEYRFRVRAKNVYERLSNEGVFAFTILPPWYRTWWAYSVYLLIAGTSVLSLVRWRVHASQQKARQLEVTIAERTAQVVAQKNRMEEQSHQLQEMDRVKSRFFANISHEFRTPLTLILGPLEQMLATFKDKKAQQALQMVRYNAVSLLRLVNQLHDLARLEAGRLTLHASAGDLVPYLRIITMAFASLAERRNMMLLFHTEMESLPAYFDPDALEKIFYNLLANAFKFTLDGGKVSVAVAVSSGSGKSNGNGKSSSSQHGVALPSVTAAADLVTITVKDTGIGIPADKLPHVFDRFYQVTESHAGSTYSASTRKHEGTGIGLSLARELVELHHGTIHVNSAEGFGTEVVVRLPLGKSHLKAEEIVASDKLEVASEEDAKTPSIQQSIDPAIHPSRDQTIILVVEDNADMRTYLRACLEPGYRVIEAGDGEAGLEMAREWIPDLVISDVMMPMKGGFELCAELKTDEKTSHLPVILLTARVGDENRLEGLETGADAYLTKPFNARELLVLTANFIRLRRKLREKFSTESFLKSGRLVESRIDEAFLKRATVVVEKNISDEKFGVEALAEQLGMSRTQLHRKLRALTNQPASLFIRSLRLHHARKLLRQYGSLINEVAFMVGFNSHAYFTKCFHEEFGCSPTEFIKGGEIK